MTLRERLGEFFDKYGRIGGNNGANLNVAIEDVVRAELLRAAEIADQCFKSDYGLGHYTYAQAAREIAAAIRKQAE